MTNAVGVEGPSAGVGKLAIAQFYFRRQSNIGDRSTVAVRNRAADRSPSLQVDLDMLGFAGRNAYPLYK